MAAFMANIKINFGGLFAPERDIAVARAPAVFDILGGVAEAGGCLMLKSSLDTAVITGVQKRRDRRIVIKILVDDRRMYPLIDFHMDDLVQKNRPITLNKLSRFFIKSPEKQWAVLPLGIFTALLRQKLAEFECGVTIGIQQKIPHGAGVCARAALLCATAGALNKILQLGLDDYQLTRICHMVYEHWLQAPASLMNIYTILTAENNKMLLLRSQPHERIDALPIPAQTAFFVLHLIAADGPKTKPTTDARIASFMARKIIFDSLAEKLPFGGYLCNIPESEWHQKFKTAVPDRIKGQAFLDQYGTHHDRTVIEPETVYRPQIHAETAILENARTERFAKLLEDYGDLNKYTKLREAGRLLYGSFDSRAQSIPLPAETNYIVQWLKDNGTGRNIWGAAVPGPAAQHSVLIFAQNDAVTTISNLMAQVRHKFGRESRLLSGSLPGVLNTAIQLTFFK